MTGINSAMESHLAQGHTTLAHAWQIKRKDGTKFSFTDHDLNLTFEGDVFLANSGLAASALSQTTGLSVDNTEALGVLNAASVREDEIEQGRFDGAEVMAWLVNWADVSQRWLQFRGTIGEVRRSGGAFKAELRGLTEALNRPIGRVFQKPCTAVLGDGQCRFNVDVAGYSTVLDVSGEKDRRVFTWENLSGFENGWFTRGRFEVRSGPAEGLWGTIKHDRINGNTRTIELWEPIRGDVGEGTEVRLVAGCDRRLESCRLKFNNILNFQGFPDLPSEDWVLAVPRSSGSNTGGSLR